ncbi:MAG: ribonuclease III [Bdellovibrio sp.]
MIEVEQRIGYDFHDKELLLRALTHKSYANELKNGLADNEKLEFLGDAVLALVVGELLLEKFPEDHEGGLSKKRASIVNEQVLCELALTLGLNQYLRLGRGEILTGGMQKPRLIASAFEALVGALYLDGGFAATRAFLRQEMEKICQQVCVGEDFEKDYKTRLQEVVQKSSQEAPRYELLEEKGPPHNREFHVCVKVQGAVWGEGQGRSKKAAEQMAAQSALKQRKSD